MPADVFERTYKSKYPIVGTLVNSNKPPEGFVEDDGKAQQPFGPVLTGALVQTSQDGESTLTFGLSLLIGCLFIVFLFPRLAAGVVLFSVV